MKQDFTTQEHKDNLIRLGVNDYNDLVGQSVYYSREVYGVHKVIKWDDESGEYLLDLDGSKFYSNPFRIFLI
jgi:hypothetical protein